MQPERAKITETLLAIATGFVVLHLFLHREWMVIAAAVAGMIGLLFPWLGGWITIGWTKLAQGLGWINGRVLLSAVFFLVLTPIAMLRKLGGGGKALALKRTAGSHWSVRDHTYAAADLEKPW